MARKNRKRKSKYVLSTITEKRLDKYADFSLDDTIKNIICDAGIQTALLKEVIPETMGLLNFQTNLDTRPGYFDSKIDL